MWYRKILNIILLQKQSITKIFDSLTEASADATLTRTMTFFKWHKPFKEKWENDDMVAKYHQLIIRIIA